MTCPACGAGNEASALSCASCGAELLADTEVAPQSATVIAASKLAPGALFADRFEIVRPLGRGGMGIVYLARDRRLDDELVAIKLLRPDFAADPTMAARFKSEIKLARRVRHKNVGAIHDYGEDGRLLYISMEFVDGVDLKRHLHQHGALSGAAAYEVATQVAEGLHAVHEAGIIHRDLKTPNIMIDAKRVARLMDFGIAKQHGNGATTGSGRIIGTPEYMSPEQAQGKKLDYRSDLYSLGIVIYEIFTGRVPFRGETPIATILKHIQEPPTLEGPEASRLPRAIVPVLKKCLAKDPADRYASAHELVEALRRARTSGSQPELVPTAVFDVQTQPPSPPPKGRGLALVATIVVLLAGGLGFWMSRRGSTVSAPPPASVTNAKVPAPTVPTPPPPTIEPPVERTLPPIPTVAAATEAPSASPSRRPVTAPVAAPPRGGTAATPPPPPLPSPSPITSNDPGWLQVAVKPWATVFVDGKRVDETPIDRLTLPAGRHEVRLERPGYEPHLVTVTIEPGQTYKVRFNFETEGRPRK
jgi:serine/threonine-protein kinase